MELVEIAREGASPLVECCSLRSGYDTWLPSSRKESEMWIEGARGPCRWVRLFVSGHVRGTSVSKGGRSGWQVGVVASVGTVESFWGMGLGCNGGRG